MATSPIAKSDELTRRIETHLHHVADGLGPAPDRSIMPIENAAQVTAPIGAPAHRRRKRVRIGVAAGLATATLAIAVGVMGVVLRIPDRVTLVSDELDNDVRLWPAGRTRVEKSSLSGPQPGSAWFGLWGDREQRIELMVQPMLPWEPPGSLDQVLAGGGAEPIGGGQGQILQWSDLTAKRSVILVAFGTIAEPADADLAAIARGITITGDEGQLSVQLRVEPPLPLRYLGDRGPLDPVQLWSITGKLTARESPFFLLAASVPSKTGRDLAPFQSAPAVPRFTTDPSAAPPPNGPDIAPSGVVRVGDRSVVIEGGGNKAARQARWTEDGVNMHLVLFGTESQSDLIDFIASLERITPAEFDKRLAG
jgi:hypothetical protein